MNESKEQKDECRELARRISILSGSIKNHAIQAVVTAQPELNTMVGLSQLRNLFDKRWDFCLAIFEEAKAAGTLGPKP